MARKKTPDNPRDFSAMTSAEVLEVITEDMKRSKSYKASFITKWAAHDQAYQAYKDPSKMRASGANLYIPYIYSTIETALPKLLNSIFDSKPYISYKPVAGDDDEKAKALTRLVDYQLRQKMKISGELYNIFKSTLLYGTAISKQTWKYEEVTTIKRARVATPITLESGEVIETNALQPTEVKKVIYDAPQMKNIPLGSFFYDPAYTDIHSSPWACHEYNRELYELKIGAKAGEFKNVDKIGTVNTEEVNFGAAADKANMRDGVKIWEYWTNDYKVLIANETTVIQVIQNPYYHRTKPFTKWCTVPEPNAFYGKSMVETLVDLQAELNTLRSQRLDNVAMALNRMFLINKNAQIDTSQLVSRPNGFIEVDDIVNDIKELQMSDVTSSAYQDEQVVKGDMDVTSGIHSYDRGQNPERKDTATVASLLTGASSERFKLQAIMMEEDPLADVGRQLAELNKQFLEDDTFIRIINEEGVEEAATISFDDIDLEYDVMAVGTAIEPSVNKEIRQGQLIQLLNVSSTIPEVNKAKLMREIFKAFEFKDVESMITEVPPPPTIDPAATGNEVPGLFPQLGGTGPLSKSLQTPG